MAHEPVLLDEMLTALAPAAGEVYVDGTFGGGGYARAILAAASCTVVALDRDPEAIEGGNRAALPGLTLIEGRFGELDRHAAEAGRAAVDGVVLDLGVSSFQLDEPGRGFSFQKDGPLDMRMGKAGPSAADLVNEADEADLVRILGELGEEPEAKRVARAIVARRAEAPFATTRELARAIAAAKRRVRPGRDPATNAFQALRMAVNDELGELERGLVAAERVLRPGGRLVVVAFHSLEDRLVKRFVDGRGGREVQPSRHLPPRALPPARFRWLNRAVVRPGEAETARNPRARSARLRAALRCGGVDAAVSADVTGRAA